MPQEQSLWDGACFVFDDRVSVTHGQPLTPEDLTSPHHEEGVSCVHCHDTRTEEDRKRYRQRQQQIELAKKRGERHLGS